MAEHNDAHADEEDALEGVGDRVRDGVDRVEAVEGYFAANSERQTVTYDSGEMDTMSAR